ncbi:unnamed protein product [Merluccius merluccius]
MHFLLLFSRQGRLRLQKWFTPTPEREKKKIIRDMTTMVLARKPRTCNFLHWKDQKGIPHTLMAPLPKRPALDKANGASAMFNTGMLQYQQALANMQFQQQAAFLPSGSILCMTPAASVVPMMHGGSPATAATTSATSLPFATASANQDSSLSKLTTNEYMQLIPIISADHLSSHKYLTQM